MPDGLLMFISWKIPRKNGWLGVHDWRETSRQFEDSATKSTRDWAPITCAMHQLCNSSKLIFRMLKKFDPSWLSQSVISSIAIYWCLKLPQAPIFRTFREGKLRYFLFIDLLLSFCGLAVMIVVAVLEILVFSSGCRKGARKDSRLLVVTNSDLLWRYHDISWIIMIYNELSWYIMNYHDISWYIMIYLYLDGVKSQLYHSWSLANFAAQLVRLWGPIPQWLDYKPWWIECNSMMNSVAAPINGGVHKWGYP